MSGYILPPILDSPARRERIFRPILIVDDDPFRAFARCAALEKLFLGVNRTANAAEAFICLDEPSFAGKLALVIVGLNLPGVAGPAFVGELTRRLPHTPILALGREGETAENYPGRNVHYLPVQASPAEILAEASKILTPKRARVA